MSTLIGEMEIRLRADIARLQRDMDDARRVVGDATASMTRAANTAKAAFAGMAAGFGMSEIIRMSDQYAKFTAQLRLATDSQLQYNQAYADVKRIASTSQADLAATGTLYGRIASGTKELGLSQQKVAAIVEATNLSLKVSGATSEESASAILQLSQAFGAGALRGEEFNAVNEAAPRLMRAIADGMGVPVGALKNMASEGKITSQVLAEVLPGALDTLRDESSKVQTVAGAFTNLKSNVMEFVGMESQASGAVSALTGGINLLANNLDLLTGSALTLGAAKVGSVLAGWAVETYKQVAASMALQAANVALAESELASAGAKLGQLGATQAMIVVAREEAVAKLASSNSNIAAARTAIAAAEAAGVQSFALYTVRLATAELTVAEAQRSAMLAELAILGRQQASVSAQMTAALAAQTAAQAALNKATAGGAAVAGVASRALGLLGGPVGAIITLLGAGVMAWQAWGDKGSEAEKKVTQTLAEEIDDYLANLQKQIDKLKERNDLAGKKMTPAAEPTTDSDKKREAIVKEINRVANDTDMNITAKTELMRVWGGRLAKLTGEMESFNVAQQKNKDLTFDAKYAEWLGKNGSAAQKEAYDLEQLRKEYGRVTPEMQKFVREKYADKGVKAEVSEYATLIVSIREKIAASKQEEAGATDLTEAQKLQIALDEKVKEGKLKLTPAHKAEYEALIKTLAASESVIATKKRAAEADKEIADFNKRYSEGLEATSKVLEKMVTDAQDEADKNEEAAKTYGLSKTEIEKLTLARLEDQMAQHAGMGLTLGEIETLEKMIAAKKRSVSALGSIDVMDDAKKASEELDKLLDPTKAQSFGDALRTAFGSAGDSISKLTGSLQKYGEQQAANEDARALAATASKGTDAQRAKAIADLAQINRRSTQQQLASYGDMAGAAAGFFSEHSKGYRALMATSQVFHAAELAMELEATATKLFSTATVTAAKTTAAVAENVAVASTVPVTLAAEGAKSTAYGVSALAAALAAPFPANIPAFATVAAMLAAIGVAVSGGGSGAAGVNPNSAAERQKIQGTGTVLGDPAAKSASMAHSLEIMQKNSELELDYQNSMLGALRNIETALGGAAKGILQTGGITGGSAFGTVASANNSLIGASHTKDITDSGVQFAGTFGQLRSGAGRGRQYEDVYTTSDGGLFRSGWSRTDTNYKALSAEAMKPFSLIFDNMGDLLVDAGAKLGQDSAWLTSAINAISVDFGVSLRGLTGQDLTDALSAGVSVAMDKVTTQAFPYIQQFQKMGEGLGETLVRVASDVQGVDSVFSSMSKSVLGMSIEAKERLVEAAGGLEKFASSAKSFMQNFYSEEEQRAATKAKLNPVLAQYGLTTEGANAQKMFRDFVIGLNVTTAAGAQTYATLMGLEQAFYDVTEAAISQRKDLQEQLDQLTMTSAELLAKQRDALDESNRALFDQVQAAQKAKDAQDAAKSSLGDFIGRMKSFAETTASLNNSLVLGDLTTLTPEQQYAEARRQFEQTRQAAGAGDATAQGNLQSIEQAFLQVSKKLYAGDAQYSSDLATVMRTNDELSKWAAGSVDVAQASLDALNNSSASLTDISSTLKLIAQGVQYLPAALAGQDAPTFTAAYAPIDYSRMGTLDMAPLVAEVKALREEVKGLRADGQKQSDAEMAANAAAAQRAAETVADATRDSATDKAWAAANSERKPS
jgi:tape measure domain-containing protein